MRALLAAFSAVLLLGAQPTARVNDAAVQGDALPRTLAEFGFFAGPGPTSPAPGLEPYALNAPLFSDYAQKQRFVYVPKGRHVEIGDNGRLLFPVGSALIKTFGYGEGGAGEGDYGKGEDFRPIETRVLLHRADGWLALPYVWNADLSEARLKVAGKRVPVTLTRPDGEEVSISYAVPNKNQCKECHLRGKTVQPIGPKLRNLDDGERLVRWRETGLLAEIPDHAVMPDYLDASAPTDARARAYLDVNCGHCHYREGSASNSGLFLTWDEPVGPSLGINKHPVAAGRGSGGLQFAIDPGHADRSIIAYRMNSTEAGIAMPELGRALIHDEGVALIRQWIDAMPGGPMHKQESAQP